MYSDDDAREVNATVVVDLSGFVDCLFANADASVCTSLYGA